MKLLISIILISIILVAGIIWASYGGFYNFGVQVSVWADQLKCQDGKWHWRCPDVQIANQASVSELEGRLSREIEDIEEAIATSDEPQLITDESALELAIITAYTTRPEEGTTCIGYYGENLCYRHEYENEKLVACPSKYGTSTLVEIEGIRYRCADRMKPSWWEENRFDIYMGRGDDAVLKAMNWGKRELGIKIIDN